ncbi:MAG: nucleotidyltransferase [Candidatus Lokiarchaeota archaeon]|nr:nucleotidyltransferase [Candidatus Lokiarchaeota archaeon]
MMKKEDILRILKDELNKLYENFGVKKIGLFGSYVRGEQTKDSDIDILVDFEKYISFFKFIELEDYLSEKLNTKVDLVSMDALKPLIKSDILDEAIYA